MKIIKCLLGIVLIIFIAVFLTSCDSRSSSSSTPPPAPAPVGNRCCGCGYSDSRREHKRYMRGRKPYLHDDRHEWCLASHSLRRNLTLCGGGKWWNDQWRDEHDELQLDCHLRRHRECHTAHRSTSCQSSGHSNPQHMVCRIKLQSCTVGLYHPNPSEHGAHQLEHHPPERTNPA